MSVLAHGSRDFFIWFRMVSLLCHSCDCLLNSFLKRGAVLRDYRGQISAFGHAVTHLGVEVAPLVDVSVVEHEAVDNKVEHIRRVVVAQSLAGKDLVIEDRNYVLLRGLGDCLDYEAGTVRVLDYLRNDDRADAPASSYFGAGRMPKSIS